VNLHKDKKRKKLITLLVMAAILISVACVFAGRQRGLIEVPSLPAAVLDDETSDGSQKTPISDADVTQPTTVQPQSTTTQSTEADMPPVVVVPPDYQPQRAQCSGHFKVTSNSANVRTDADKNAQMVRVIHAGESYEVIAQKPSSGGILWFEILLGDGTSGYVSSSYGTYDGKIVNGKVYLTFDDGPSSNTLRILDTLDKYGVKATFFVIYHPGQESTYRSIVERGHVIAVHSYTHTYSQIYSSTDAFHSDISKLSDYIYDVTGVRCNVLRFPGGSSNTISQKYCKGIMTKLAREVEERGYSYYDWDVDSGDADDNTVDKDRIVSNIKARMSNRRDAIILMHDARAKTTTADALPEIIEYLQGRGYQILPITSDTHTSHQQLNN